MTASTPQTATRQSLATLKTLGLFRGIGDDILRTLADELDTRQAPPGSIVVQEGDVDDCMFVVIGGELEVVKSSDAGAEVRVALLGPGDWFGELSVIDAEPRTATVRAVAPSLLLVMSRDDIHRLLYHKHKDAFIVLLANVARELGRRLRVADGIIARSSDELARQYVDSTSRR